MWVQHLTLLGMNNETLFPSVLTELCLTSKIFQQEKKTALCVRRGASDTSSVIGRELPRTQSAPRPASIKTGLPPKKGAFWNTRSF